MKKEIRHLGTYCVGAIFGPALYLLTTLIFKGQRELVGPVGSNVENFLHDVVFLLWPAQILGVAEAIVGPTFAILLSLTANILLFLALGILASFATKISRSAVTSYVVILFFVLTFSYWGSGSSIKHLNVMASIFSACFYLFLAYYSAKFSKRISSKQHTKETVY